jgi:hypothetical protein
MPFCHFLIKFVFVCFLAGNDLSGKRIKGLCRRFYFGFLVAEHDGRLTPFEWEAPKSLKNYRFKTVLDYSHQLKFITFFCIGQLLKNIVKSD